MQGHYPFIPRDVFLFDTAGSMRLIKRNSVVLVMRRHVGFPVGHGALAYVVPGGLSRMSVRHLLGRVHRVMVGVRVVVLRVHTLLLPHGRLRGSAAEQTPQDGEHGQHRERPPPVSLRRLCRFLYVLGRRPPSRSQQSERDQG